MAKEALKGPKCSNKAKKVLKWPNMAKMASMSQKAQSGPKQSGLPYVAQNDQKFLPPNINA